MSIQDELNFPPSEQPGVDGLARWRGQRQEIFKAMARANGLPLGHPCHIELRDGTTLEGLLQLATEELFLDAERNPKLKLRIERCTFSAVEILSVARLD